ncbi:MAG: nucleotide sugar dehydrogenase, partial [Candidatus Omnitrophica bacterium]|nr:nucleotide sugar dehydrogenase [Candidatus Omnitrophota bacterium]
MSINNIIKLIESKKAVVSVVGLGYVGLPLILSFNKAGFKTIGIDVSKDKIKKLKSTESYIDDVPNREIIEAYKTRRFSVSDSFQKIRDADCVIICVPTPLGKTKEPDLSFVLSAVDRIAPHLKANQLVVLESTTFPGTTDEVIAPRIEAVSKLRVGQDVLVGFSPERVDPANKNWKINEIPKVVGGMGSDALQAAKALYNQVFLKVVPASSTKTAEMVKLLENTFRSVNIGLINEMAIICDTLKVDVWEVIEAAATKPFGFMPFYPGPGIGGHCINIDSMYLAWKARLHGYEPKLI